MSITPSTTPPPGTRSGKKRKKDMTDEMTDEQVAEASLTQNMGTLNNSQAMLATLLLRSQYTQERLREGDIIPFTWQRAATIMKLADFALGHPEYKELYGAEHLQELVKEIKEVFPYDRTKWDTHRQFVCRADARDMNGHPPSLGLVLLPIDPSRQP